MVKKVNMFDMVESFVVNHIDERLFGTNNFHFRNVVVNFDDVGLYWGYYVRRMKQEGIKEGRHGEKET